MKLTQKWDIVFSKYFEFFLRRTISKELFINCLKSLGLSIDFVYSTFQEPMDDHWEDYYDDDLSINNKEEKVDYFKLSFIYDKVAHRGRITNLTAINDETIDNLKIIKELSTKSNNRVLKYPHFFSSKIIQRYKNEKRCYTKVFVEPFEKSFNPFTSSEKIGLKVDNIFSVEDFLKANKSFLESNSGRFDNEIEKLTFEETIGLFFFGLVTMRGQERNLIILDQLYDFNESLFVPQNNILPSSIFNLATKLPEDFCTSLFFIFNNDIKWINKLLITIKSENELEFYKVLNECDLDKFLEKYFSVLALYSHFFHILENDQFEVPNIKEFINVSNDDYKNVTNHFKALLQEIDRIDKSNLRFIGERDNQTTDINEDDENKEKSIQNNKSDNCFIAGISGFDIDKLVDKLTTKQLFESKEYGPLVVGTSEGDTAEKVKDNLHYFFEPDSSYRSFILKWNGMHAMGLKLLILLLLNKNDAITEENAIDEKEKDFISPNISKNIGQKFWSTVNQVFNRNSVINSSISPTCPEDTRKKYIHYMHFIAHIVYSCKK